MMFNPSFEVLRNINEYIESMNKFGCTRTIHYTDILACTDKYIEIVRGAIDDYVKCKIKN